MERCIGYEEMKKYASLWRDKREISSVSLDKRKLPCKILPFGGIEKCFLSLGIGIGIVSLETRAFALIRCNIGPGDRQEWKVFCKLDDSAALPIGLCLT
jgi:hypothetical protein